ncbi:MAG: hypothetical protein KatS3mg077_1343 [Candidatus Binatia bacterium]|nr:MAG: hypothetical protein KatS3mg077_1343 [Candidatus Binatia bacterium]
MKVDWRVYGGIFLVSLATLMTEVALTRLFSFSIWYHFAYMTISVALLGYGAAGSVYYAVPELTRRGTATALGWSATAAALGLVICLAVVSRVPFDPARLFPGGQFDPWADPHQWLYLVVYYFAVTIPFGCAGLCISIVFGKAPGRIAQLYFSDLVGAALGCGIAVALLAPLGAPGLILLGASLFALSAAFLAWERKALAIGAGALTLALFLGALSLGNAVDPQPSSTKFLARLRAQGAAVLFKKWSPVYRVDVVGSREGKSLRMAKSAAWGVSNRFPGTSPENLVITHDGDASTMLYRFDGNPETFKILDWSVLAVPYLFLSKPDVLVIGVGGGVDIAMALRKGANHVTGVELNPVTVDVLRRHFADYAGHLFDDPRVTLSVDEGRNFVRRTPWLYDLVQLTGIDTLAAVYSGAYVLSESYLYTREAVLDYLNRLKPGGFLSIVRGDKGFADMPPRQVLRLIVIIADALERMGITDPANHLIVVRSHPQGTFIPIYGILVGKSPISDGEVQRLEKHLELTGFEAWHLPGRRVDSPVARVLSLGTADREVFLDKQWLNLGVTTDDRPFFFNFLKWSRLFAPERSRADYTFASGQLVLLAILAQSVVFALLLIVTPLLRFGLRSMDACTSRFLIYFASLGLGFMFIEISYIQRFTLFLGSPVFSLAMVLGALLLSSGIGSFLSSQLAVLRDPSVALKRLFVALVLLNILYVAGLPLLFGAALGSSLAVRFVVAALALAPAGLLLGMFLPVGMRIVAAQTPEAVPWAWAANGVASVVGAILAIVLAMSAGFRSVNLIALGIYALGILAMLDAVRRANPERVA